MPQTPVSAAATVEVLTNFDLQRKIAALDAIAADLPVVIVHSLRFHNVEYMSPKGREILGVSLEELKAMGGAGYLDRFFNPEDHADYVPRITALLESRDENEFVSFFHQVRRSEKHEWSWYLGTTKIFLKDAEGKPTHIITFASPVDPLHHVTNKVNRLLEENNFLRRYQKVFALLTSREKEILRLMALGETAEDIAAKLHISEKTAQTHRRNIKAKLNAQSNYDITRFAQAFDLI